MVFNPFSAFGGNDAPQGDGAPSYSVIRAGEFDVIDALPAEAQGHLSALRDNVEEIYESLDRLKAKREDARQDRGEAETAYRTLTDPAIASRAGRSFTYSEDHPDVVAAKAKFDKAAAAARAAQDRYDEMAERWRKHKRLLTDIESYVATAGALKVAQAAKLKFPTVDRLASEVERVRADLAELAAEKHAVNSSAYPAAEAKARVRAELEMLSDLGKPRVTQLIDHGGAAAVGWPHVVAKSSIHGMNVRLPGDEALTAHDLPASGIALVCWLHKDALLAALYAEIDAVAEDDAALSTEQRTAKLADLDARILDLERIECALVRNAGGTVDFREDADPRAVLGVDGPAPRED